MMDSYLAILHEITTGNFNKVVCRNLERFPSAFMFEVTREYAITHDELSKKIEELENIANKGE